MTNFKKGFNFRHLQSDVEIIERYDNLILAKIQPDFGQAFWDISSIQRDGNGDEHFYPSPNGNGLKAELVDGGPREPKSFEEMQRQFDDLVTAAVKREIAAAEAKDAAIRREQEFVDRKRKGQQAKDHRKALNDQLRAIVATTDLTDFISSKKAKKIAEEIYLTELFISNI